MVITGLGWWWMTCWRWASSTFSVSPLTCCPHQQEMLLCVLLTVIEFVILTFTTSP